MNQSTVPQPGKRKKTWTMLLVSETGKTIRIKWFKALAVINLVLLLGAVAAGGAFYYLYESESRENRLLRSALTNETPVAAVAAVEKFESKEEEPTNSIAALPQKLESGDSTTKSVREKALETGPTEKSTQEKPFEEKESSESESASSSDGETRKKGLSFLVPGFDTEEEPTDSENRKPLRVAIEDFEYSNGDQKHLYVRYKIKNTASRSQPVSGHAVVVLEGDDRGKPKWLALPNVHLVSGIPTGEEEGQAFSIANYKFMKFRTEDRHDPEQFSKACVYVFDKAGALLLKEVRNLTESSDSNAG